MRPGGYTVDYLPKLPAYLDRFPVLGDGREHEGGHQLDVGYRVPGKAAALDRYAFRVLVDFFYGTKLGIDRVHRTTALPVKAKSV